MTINFKINSTEKEQEFPDSPYSPYLQDFFST